MGMLTVEAQNKLEKDSAKKEAKAEAKAEAALKKKLASQVDISRYISCSVEVDLLAGNNKTN